MRGRERKANLKCRSSLISLSVLKQNIECSNGVIRLMATLVPEGTWMADTLFIPRAKKWKEEGSQ